MTQELGLTLNVIIPYSFWDGVESVSHITLIMYTVPAVPPDTLNCTASPIGVDMSLIVSSAVLIAILENDRACGDAGSTSSTVGVPVSNSPLSSLPANDTATFLFSAAVLLFLCGALLIILYWGHN